ncbi:MAG: bifunctional hydroxymethylpyrimidine kinase/phosphomethylpyrimidine kinase [Terriglobales bacterium]
MVQSPPIVLTIAGFDPSAGAGITADIKTIAAHGGYGVACITALTVQSTLGVRRVQPVELGILAESLSEMARDMTFAAVHVGMLASAETANVVADFLSQNRPKNIVLDPVINATSGAVLLDAPGLRVLIERLIPVAAVITPNLHEASIISGLAVTTRQDMPSAAAKLHQMGAKAVIITGGHFDQPCDLLSCTGNHGVNQQFFEARRINSTSTHGTGCAFSTAIACQLAKGRSLADAVDRAQAYVSRAIEEAYPVGKGVGPLNHLYGRREMEP